MNARTISLLLWSPVWLPFFLLGFAIALLFNGYCLAIDAFNAGLGRDQL